MPKVQGGLSLPPSPPEGENKQRELTRQARKEKNSSKQGLRLSTRSNRVTNGPVKSTSPSPKQSKESGREPRQKQAKRGSEEQPKPVVTKRVKTERIVTRRQKNEQAKKALPKDEESDTDSSSSQSSNSLGKDPYVYEVEDILDYWIEKGEQLYLVKWKNWDEDWNTWEEKDNLNNCNDMLISFFYKRVEEIKLYERSNKPNPRKSVNLLPKLPLPEDPRTFKAKIVHFFESSGMSQPTPIELEGAFKLHKQGKWITSEWSQEQIESFLLSFILGRLQEDELHQLKTQLIHIMAQTRYHEMLQELEEWEMEMNKTTEGKPKISVINQVDLTGRPNDFEYINDYVAGRGVEIPNNPLISCSCGDEEASCKNNKGICCSSNHDIPFAYSSHKRIVVPRGTPVYECNKNCLCGPTCTNRVVQDGIVSLEDSHLRIFRTPNNKGWGVQTMKKIKKGTFVALYAGEIILSSEAEERGKGYDQHGLTYLFDLDLNTNEDGECMYTVDAIRMGNISHFFNHSCMPNLTVFNVFVDCIDINLPKLALFANKDIDKYDELTFDYKENADENPAPRSSKKKNTLPQTTTEKYLCQCGTRKCRKYMF